MAAGAKVEGENPLGKDGAPGGDSDSPDVNKYVDWIVETTNHLFVAPKDKYSDVASVLGIKEADAATREKAVKLKRGTGYVQVGVTLDSGANLRLVCSPSKIGELSKLRAKKVYGKEVRGSYLPKTQTNR